MITTLPLIFQTRRRPPGERVPVGPGPVLLAHQRARLGGDVGPVLRQTNCKSPWGVGILPGSTTTSSSVSSPTSTWSISTLSGGYERSPPARPDGSDRNPGSSHLARHRLCRLHLRCEHSSDFLPRIEHVFSASCIFHLTTSSISLHPSSQICTTETLVGATHTGCDLKRDFASHWPHCPLKRRTSTHCPQGGNIAEQLAQSAHHLLTY